MSKNLYIAGTGPGVVKAVVVLGVMELLAKRGLRIGFFRTVVQKDPLSDPLISLIKSRYDISTSEQSMFGCTEAVLYDLISGENEDEIHSLIMERYHSIEKESDFVVCVGSDYRSMNGALEFEFNLAVARNLGAPIIPMVLGRRRKVEEIVDAIQGLKESLDSRGCDVLSVIVNRVDPEHLGELVKRFRELKDNVPVFALPEHPLLDKPTIAEIKRALRANVLHGDPQRLDREVVSYKVAAMELTHFLDHLQEGCMVITPGDRSDILIGTVVADESTAYPSIAGIVLTGGFTPEPSVMRLFEGLKRSSLPILQVQSDTFTTATKVNSLHAVIAPENNRKIAGALGMFEANVDVESLGDRIAIMKSSRVTPLMFQYGLLSRARSKYRHIVLPEGAEERILRAAEIMRLRDVADITLLGNVTEVKEKIRSLGLTLGDVPIIDPTTSKLREDFGETYFELRKHRGITPQLALDAVGDVSIFGTMMVYRGLADGMVSGAVHTTQHTIRPALEFIKTKPGCPIISSVFFMCLPDRVLVYGDCAVNPDPNAEQLANIAISSAETAEMFGVEPRIALLSYSTGESGSGADVEKVKEATMIAKEMRPDLKLEGPIQYDAAIDPDVARLKLPNSEVAGRATVFIFPDLNAGNNAYKAVQRAANAIAIGPVLQGLNKPVNDLSRGCTVPDIVNTIAITAIQAQMDGAPDYWEEFV